MAIRPCFGIFWENILLTILLLIGVWELIVHGNFSLIQANHILKMRWTSHYVDITYVFLYLIFRCFIFIENCNAFYCEYYIKICNFIFIFSRKKIISYILNLQFKEVKYMLLIVNVIDRTSVIVATWYLLKVTKRTLQQKVHSPITCFKNVDLKQHILK